MDLSTGSRAASQLQWTTRGCSRLLFAENSHPYADATHELFSWGQSMRCPASVKTTEVRVLSSASRLHSSASGDALLLWIREECWGRGRVRRAQLLVGAAFSVGGAPHAGVDRQPVAPASPARVGADHADGHRAADHRGAGAIQSTPISARSISRPQGSSIYPSMLHLLSAEGKASRDPMEWLDARSIGRLLRVGERTLCRSRRPGARSAFAHVRSVRSNRGRRWVDAVQTALLEAGCPGQIP